MDDAADLRQQVDALLEFLPAFEAAGESWTGEWKGGQLNASGAIQMPWFDHSTVLGEFMSACYRHGWVVPDASRASRTTSCGGWSATLTRCAMWILK